MNNPLRHKKLIKNQIKSSKLTTLWEFELVIGIAEHVSNIHVSTNIQKVKLKNVGQIQKSMGPFEKMPLL